mmetsp:Transcript_26470/g.66304  ORF Transcript_26470/g.66304 Transcript_26470/m.66304 type:complete len:82 (-) Transcript_26470:610-855(-)
MFLATLRAVRRGFCSTTNPTADVSRILSSVKCASLAEKFESVDHLLSLESRDLKEMAIKTKERKKILRAVEAYRQAIKPSY